MRNLFHACPTRQRLRETTSLPSSPGRSKEVKLEARGKEDVFARQSRQQERLDHEYDGHCASLLTEKTTDPIDDNSQRQ
jgi:hypothetical protein